LPDATDNLNGVFELQMMFFDRAGCGNTLHFPGAIRQDHEDRFSKDTNARNPAAKSNLVPNKTGNRFDEYALTGSSHPQKPPSEESLCWSRVGGGAIQLPGEGRHSMGAVS
jgi:hypothetical protein